MKISAENSNKIANMSLLCAIFVVFIHCGSPDAVGSCAWIIDGLIFKGIFCIAVPFFFVVSGYFLGCHDIETPKCYVTELRKRIVSLGVPFYGWSIMLMLFWLSIPVVANIVHLRNIFTNTGHILNLHTLLNLSGFGWNAYLFPFWYIRSLVLLILIAPILVKMNKVKYWLVLPFAMMVLYMAVTPEGADQNAIKHIIRYLFSPSALFYFSVGLLISRHENKIAVSNKVNIALFVIGLIILTIRLIINPQPGPGGALRDITVPFFLIPIWHWMTTKELPTILKGLTFLIYGGHVIIISIVDIAISATSFRGTSINDWRFYVFRAIVMVLLSLISAILMRRLFPRLSTILSGGRSSR